MGCLLAVCFASLSGDQGAPQAYGYDYYRQAALELRARADLEDAWRSLEGLNGEHGRVLESARLLERTYSGVLQLVARGNDYPLWPQGVTPPWWGARSDEEPLPEEWSLFRRVALLHGATAYAQASEGRTAASINTIAHGLEFADRLCHLDMLLLETGRACEAILLQWTARVAPRLSVSDNQRLSAIVRSSAARSASLPPEEAYRWYAEEFVRQVVEDPSVVDAESSFYEGTPFAQDARKMLEKFQNMGAAERALTARSIVDELLNAYRSTVQAMKRRVNDWVLEPPPPATVSQAIAWSEARTLQVDLDSAARTQIRYGLTTAVLAIEQYRWEHGGVLPDGLREVSPGAAVTDPATGQPYAYRLISGGYEVYSVGTSRLGIVRLDSPPGVPGVAGGAEGVKRYFHFDGLGSTRALTDSSGNVTDTYEYNAFGVLESSTGTSVNPFRYVGQWGYYDDGAMGSSSGLLLLGVRYYSPDYGRRLSRSGGGTNPYLLRNVVVGNPPVSSPPVPRPGTPVVPPGHSKVPIPGPGIARGIPAPVAGTIIGLGAAAAVDLTAPRPPGGLGAPTVAPVTEAQLPQERSFPPGRRYRNRRQAFMACVSQTGGGRDYGSACL